MKKLMIVATAAFLFSGIGFAQETTKAGTKQECAKQCRDKTGTTSAKEEGCCKKGAAKTTKADGCCKKDQAAQANTKKPASAKKG